MRTNTTSPYRTSGQKTSGSSILRLLGTFFAVLMLLGVNNLDAQLSVLYDFEGVVQTAGAVSGADAACITPVDAIIVGAGAPTFFSGNGSSSAYAANGWPTATSPDLGVYYEFCLTNNDCVLAFTSASLDLDRSGTGPTDFQVHFSLDNFTTAGIPVYADQLLNDSWNSFTIPLTGAELPSDVCVRLYAYGAGGSGGTLRIDNVTLIGEGAEAFCGDGFCNGTETSTCADCPSVCGDGVCSLDEDANCIDCPAVCGDDLCTGDETAETCLDCPTVCGDHLCTGDENFVNCEDCEVPEDQTFCDYTLDLYDSFEGGDGWQNASGDGFVTVSFGGVSTDYTITAADGNMISYTISVPDGFDIDIVYTPSAFFNEENSFQITRPDGTTYEDGVEFDPADLTTGPDGGIAISEPNICPIPPNDTCEAALPIECGETVTGNTGGFLEASDLLLYPECDPDGTLLLPGGGAALYTYVGTGDIVTASLCGSGFDTNIRVYEGECDALTCVAGNGDNFAACGSGFRSETTFTSVIDVQYTIIIDGYDGAEGDYELVLTCIPPPPVNDLVDGAIELTCGDYADIDLTNATNDDAPDCQSLNAAAPFGLWYSFTGDGQLTTISTCNRYTGPDTNTELVLLVEGDEGLQCLDYNDDDEKCDANIPDDYVRGVQVQSYLSTISLCTEVGTTYYIYAVGDVPTDDAGFEDFRLTLECVPCPDPPLFDTACPDDIAGEDGLGIPNDEGLCGAIVTFDDPTHLEGTGTGAVTIECDPPSGSEFGVGITTVTCIITDELDQMSVCTFDVLVKDIQPPTILLIEEVITADQDAGECGAELTIPSPTFGDNCCGTGSPPTGDDCAEALTIECEDIVAGSTVGLTPSGEADCGRIIGGSGAVFYSFTGTGENTTASLSGSGFDTQIRIYDGECDALSCVAEDDDGGLGLTSEVTFFSELDVVYTIVVNGFGSAEGDYILSITCTPPIPGDDCATAIELTVNPDLNCASFESGSLDGLTESGEFETCSGSFNQDTWYSFTAEATEHEIQVNNITGSTFQARDLIFQLAEGSCGSLSQLQCGDSPNSGFTATGLTVGNDYLIRVDSWYDGVYDTEFEICVGTPPPPATNVDCANAEVIAPGTFAGVQIVQGTGGDVHGLCVHPFGNGPATDALWYSYTPAVGGFIDIQNISVSNVDSRLSVYTGACGSLACYDSNDDSNSLRSELFDVPVVAGTTYLIEWDDRWGGGAAVFDWSLTFSLTAAAPTQNAVRITQSELELDPAHMEAKMAMNGAKTAAENAFNEEKMAAEQAAEAAHYEAKMAAHEEYMANHPPAQSTRLASCPSWIITNDYNDGGEDASGFYPIGETVVTYTITDDSGNTAQESITVVVNDTEVPEIDPATCPDNFDVDTDPGQCYAVVTYAPQLLGACDGDTIICDPPSGFKFPVGTTPVTCTAVDAGGGTTGPPCEFTVTVTDNELPTIIGSSIVTKFTDNGPGCEELLNIKSPIVFDNCGILSLTNDYTGTEDATAVYPVGSTQMTWTVEDVNGNVNVFYSTVNLIDNDSPVFECPTEPVLLSAAEGCCAEYIFEAPAVTDNCSSLGMQNPEAYTVEPIPYGAIPMDVGQVELDLGDDEVQGPLPIGFEFEFFGVPYTEFYVSSNGFITFNAGSDDGCCDGQLLPDPLPSNLNNLIAFAWEDLNPPGGGLLRYETLGPLGDQILIVDFYEVANFFGGTVRVQLLIYESTGIIEIHTNAFSGDPGDEMTQGIENADGTQAYTAPGRNATDFDSNFESVAFVPTVSIPATIIVEQVEGPASGECFPLGTTTISFMATDEYDNTSFCSYDVVVTDDSAPVLDCPGEVLADALEGDCGAVVEYEINVLDNCGEVGGAAGYTVDPECTFAPLPVDGTILDLGDDEVVGPLAVGFDFDFFGESYSEFYLSSNGFITFNTPPAFGSGCCNGEDLPTPSSWDNVIALAWEDLDPGNGGQPAINVIQYQTVGSPGSQILIIDYHVVDQYPSGNNVTVQALLYEADGRIELHTTEITADDLGSMTQGIENADGTIGYAAPDRNAAVFSSANECVAFIPGAPAPDHPLTLELISGLESGSEFPIGTTTVSYGVLDAQGRGDTCTFDVTVFDVELPEITCPVSDDPEHPNVFEIPNDLGMCGAIYTYDPIVGTDNCPDAITEQTDVSGLTSGDFYPVGIHLQEYTVTDASGNPATCSFIVWVKDKEGPAFDCPEDITVAPDPGTEAAVLEIPVPEFADNCCLQEGTPSSCMATLVLSDEFGDGWEGAKMVLTIDGVPLEYTLDDINDDGQEETFLIPIANGASVTLEYVASTTVPDFELDNGFSFTLSDGTNATEEPVLAEGEYFNGTNTCITPDPITCGETLVNDYTGTDDASGEYPLGTTVVIYTATDNIGNTRECSFTVIVGDMIAPEIACLESEVNVSTDPGACSAATVPLLTPTATDDISDPDDITITATAVVTVVESSTSIGGDAPFIGFWNVFNTPDEDGGSYIFGGDVPPNFVVGLLNTPAPDQLTLKPNRVPDTNVPFWLNPDGSGNKIVEGSTFIADNSLIGSSFEFTGTVASNTLDPSYDVYAFIRIFDGAFNLLEENTAELVDGSTFTVAYGNTYTAPDINIQYGFTMRGLNANSTDDAFWNAAYDALGSVVIGDMQLNTIGLTESSAFEDGFPVGETIVIWTATDEADNSSTCEVLVTVSDTELPEITCPESLEADNESGICAAIVEYDAPEGTDNCPGATTEQTDETGLSSGSYFPVGVTTLEYTVTDASGNSAVCTFTVTVNDIEPPVIESGSGVCYTVPFDPEHCGALVYVLPPVASDLCGDVTRVNDYTGTASGSSVYPAGQQTIVTWTLTDASNNTVQITDTVKVGKLNKATNLEVKCNAAKKQFKLKWATAPGAQRYRIQIRELGGDGTIILNQNKFQPTAQSHVFPMDILDPGLYEWRIVTYCKMEDAPNLPGWQEYSKRYSGWVPLTLPCGPTPIAPQGDETAQGSKLLGDGVDALLYPNPTEGIFYIDTDLEDYTLEIFDLKGELILSQQRMKTGVAELDVQDLPNGMYLVKMYNQKSLLTKRITIQK